MRVRSVALAVAAVILGSDGRSASASGEQRALPAPTADYRFSGTWRALGGTRPICGTSTRWDATASGPRAPARAARRVLTFPDGNDSRLRNASSVVKRGVYTMAITVRFTSVDGYTRIVNYAGDDADTGLYTYNGALQLYNTDGERCRPWRPGSG